MGIISPKKRGVASSVLIIPLLILLSPLLIVAAFLYLLWGAVLYLALWLTWRKQVVVFVYSDSPIWKEYIQREMLPHLQDKAVILNWSARRDWKPSLPVLAFRYFGGAKNFNPIGLVFHPFRFVKTYRFYEAFQKFKHGDAKNVERMKAELFKALEG